jgi:hypothetical protein
MAWEATPQKQTHLGLFSSFSEPSPGDHTKPDVNEDNGVRTQDFQVSGRSHGCIGGDVIESLVHPHFRWNGEKSSLTGESVQYGPPVDQS